ncbi:MAG: DUF3168 domain-containing protein [Anaerolineae bacterium]|nr:DUF3168 domain-containing protein [Anaerolineae bacterium]NIN98507.1 DUF3168 domain-containing protein [Anaerolineae bacterium]
MPSDHIEELETALYNRLAGGTALTNLLGGTLIHNTVAPPHTEPPYVLFQQQAGGDENVTPRRSRDPIYLVKAVTLDGREAAIALDRECDTLLHKNELPVMGDWGNHRLNRTEDVSFVEQDDAGKQYFHQGGLYRVKIAEIFP